MKFFIKPIMKFKKWIVLVLFIIPFLTTFYIQCIENHNNEYWDYKVLAKLGIATEDEIKSLTPEEIKESKKEVIRNFFPTSNQYRDWNCYKRFNTNTDDWKEIFINSLSVLGTQSINDECFSENSKLGLFISYIFVYIAVFSTLITIFIDKVRRFITFKEHSVVIGLNKYSRRLINNLSDNNNIKIYERDINNVFIKELEESGEYLNVGNLEYTLEDDIFYAKEIFIMNDTDSEAMNNLALIIDKFNNIKKRREDKTKIYIEIKNRENKVFFDKKGIYDLVGDNYEIVIFSINELISQRMFKKRPLVSNLDKNNLNYNENLEILIVGFNDLSEEILYNILKLAHFDLNKYVDIKIIDDDFENLNIKYKRIIDKGLDPWENGSEIFWKLEFLSYSKIYEDSTFIFEDKFKFNRIILCDKKFNNSLDLLNFFNNNYFVQLSKNKTIIQVYNEHVNINNSIDKDTKNTYKNFFTFGDIETIITYENITNNRLYQVSKATNDYKETNESNKWENTDSFTRESNITEKLHMDIKLNILSLKINWEDENVIINTPSSNFPTLYDFYDYFFVPNETNSTNIEVESFFKNKKEIMQKNEKKEQFKKLPKIFDNFNKDYKDEKFQLLNGDKIFENWQEIEEKFYNGLNSQIKILDLFKIIDYKRGEKSIIKPRKLRLFIEGLNLSYDENNRKEYLNLIKNLIEKEKEFYKDVINIDDYKTIKKIYEKEIVELGLITRKDYIDFYDTLSKDEKEEFEEEFENILKVTINSCQELDDFYKKYYDRKVSQRLINIENNKFKLNICMFLSALELYSKFDGTDIEVIIENLAELEHKRWNAYHILNGWKRRKISNKDQIKKEHFDLCDWKTLKKEDPNVVKYDYKNIYQISFVVHCLAGNIVKIGDK